MFFNWYNRVVVWTHPLIPRWEKGYKAGLGHKGAMSPPNHFSHITHRHPFSFHEIHFAFPRSPCTIPSQGNAMQTLGGKKSVPSTPLFS